MTIQLPTSQLGNDGPQVTALGFGAMGLSAMLYGKPGSDGQRLAVLDCVYELGCKNIDTADAYLDNEDLIGKWLQKNDRRNEIFVATKFATNIKPNGAREFPNDPPFIRAAIDKSLARLQVSQVDLWYCHRLNGEVPVETVVATMAEVVKAGKVKYLGLSECSAESLRRACKVRPIHPVQIEELGEAVVAYSPLGRGLLTGMYKSNADFEEGDYRKVAPRFSNENFPENLELVAELSALAEKKGCTTGQLTLAWLLKQEVIAIPGTKKIKYLEENMGALEVNLSDAEEKEIRRAIEKAESHGERYPEFMTQYNFTDTPPSLSVETCDFG